MATIDLHNWLTQFLASARPGAQIPFDRELAEKFDISTITVRRTLQSFASSGRIVRMKGKGTFVPLEQTGRPDILLTEPVSTVESIANELAAKISEGVLKEGDPLPFYKNLRYSFGVSSTSIHKAYELLRTRRLVSKVGRSYRVGQFSDIIKLQGNSEIVLFYTHEKLIQELFSTHESAEAFKKMERVLHEKGYHLRYERFMNLSSWVEQRQSARNFPAGIIATGSNTGMVTATELDTYLDVLNRISKPYPDYRVPLLVISTRFIKPSNNTAYLSVSHANTVIRRKLADFIHKKNYKKVFFFIDEGRIGAGRECDDAFRLLPETDHLNRLTEITFVIIPIQHEKNAETLLLRLFTKPGHLESRLSKYRPITLQELIKQMQLVDSFETTFVSTVGSGHLWLFNDDFHAEEALLWCQNNNLHVPHDIAIMGLQNDPMYLHRGISACVHDWETAGYLMAHSLIGDLPIESTTRGSIKTSALLFERLTTN